MLVLYGMTEEDRTPVELHVLVAERYIVTVHAAALSGLAALQSRHDRMRKPNRHALIVLHHIVDSMADGYFPALPSSTTR